MGIFQQFPYTNFHELNLDEILKIVKELAAEYKTNEEKINDILNMLKNIELIEDIFIDNQEELQAAINEPKYDTYFMSAFEIDATINIPDDRDLNDVKFIGGTITLNADGFTNPSIGPGSSTSCAVPSFVGTSFIGKFAHVIFADGFYILGGNFDNCVFKDVSLINGAKCVQSTNFDSCRFIANNETPTFIQTNALYDVKFSACDLEADYLPMFINVEHDETWGALGTTCRQLSLVNCVTEGRSNSLIRFNDGDVELYGHYAEGNHKPLIEIYKAASQTYGFHSISIFNSFLNTVSTDKCIVAVDEDYNYENTSFICIGCVINNCILVNTNKFLRYVVEGNKLVGTTKVYPSKVLSKVGAAYDFDNALGRSYTNGMAFFKTNSRTIYVMPEITLITFSSVYSGATTPFIVVAGTRASSGSPGAFAYCLSHPSITITAAYDSSLDLVELTLPNELGVINTVHNMSAVGMRRIYGDSTGIDYYRSEARNGFTPLEVKEIFVSPNV